MSRTIFVRLAGAAAAFSALAASALATSPASAGGGYRGGGYHGTGGYHYITPRTNYIPLPFPTGPVHNPARGWTVLK
jgi:hypothetical protein